MKASICIPLSASHHLGGFIYKQDCLAFPAAETSGLHCIQRGAANGAAKDPWECGRRTMRGKGGNRFTKGFRESEELQESEETRDFADPGLDMIEKQVAGPCPCQFQQMNERSDA